jgi:hypothetical protein
VLQSTESAHFHGKHVRCSLDHFDANLTTGSRSSSLIYTKPPICTPFVGTVRRLSIDDASAMLQFKRRVNGLKSTGTTLPAADFSLKVALQQRQIDIYDQQLSSRTIENGENSRKIRSATLNLSLTVRFVRPLYTLEFDLQTRLSLNCYKMSAKQHICLSTQIQRQ